jgi:hypothetical protein
MVEVNILPKIGAAIGFMMSDATSVLRVELLAPSGRFVARKLVLQALKQARPLTRDPVQNSQREVHDLPLANARFVDPVHRMAFVRAHV